MKVFISHSHADASLASRISNALEKTGLEVWNPDRELLPGDNWAQEVSRSLEEAQAMVVLLTPAATDCSYVRRNIEFALCAKNFSNRLIFVVEGDPDQVPRSSVPWIARRLPWIGLTESESENPQVEPIANAILSRA